MRLWRRFKQGLPVFRLPTQTRRSIQAAVTPVRGRVVSTPDTPATRCSKIVLSAGATWHRNMPTSDAAVVAGGIHAVTRRVWTASVLTDPVEAGGFETGPTGGPIR